MKLFRSKAEKELDKIIVDLQNYLSNNYKDLAHDSRKLLGQRCEALFSEGKLSEKDHLRYRRIFEDYTEKMKNYHH